MLSNNLFGKQQPTRSIKIEISDLVNKTVSPDVLLKISTCFDAVNKVILTVSSLPEHEQNAEMVHNAGINIEKFLTEKFKEVAVNQSNLLRLMIAAIKNEKAGNCQEFALMAYSILSKEGMPCEVVRINGGNHVFLVLNRDPQTPIADHANWNKEAIIVDPFFTHVYMASEIPMYLKSFCYDNNLNKCSYIPFDPKIHTLSNDVLSGLVTDWNIKKTYATHIMKK